MFVIRTGGTAEICVFSLLALLVQWSLIQIPFWLTQVTGWRVVKRGFEASEKVTTETQFHLWHLFAWTTGVAVLLGVGRLLSGFLPRIDRAWSEFGVFFAFLAVAVL
jgi:purine-cytosine permease-like protein